QLAEDFLHALQQLLLNRPVIVLNRSGEFRDEFFLLFRQFCWNDDIDGHVEIAAGGAAPLRNSAALDSERRTGLSAGRNKEPFFFSFEGRHTNLCAEYGLRK